MKETLKYYWFPILMAVLAISIPSYIGLSELYFEHFCFSKALKGDSNAMNYILRSKYKYDIPKWVIKEAINGNQYAKKIIGIEEKK